MTPPIAWYVGRDGQQYGPVGDAEFWAMQSSGQILPTDLVWRDGFPEWKPATLVQPPAPPTVPLNPVHPAAAPQPQPQVHGQSGGPDHNAYQTIQQHSAQPHRQATHSGAADQTPARQRTDRPTAAAAAATAEPAQRKRTQRPPASDGAPPSSRLRSIGRGVAWTAIVLFFAATLGAAYMMVAGDKTLMRMASAMIPQFGERIANSPPIYGFAPSPAATDQALQKTTLGQVLKKYHPEWYAERMKESADAMRGGKNEADVLAAFMQSVVKLRRQYAGDATSAPITRLKSIASLFASNLTRLKSHSVDACFQFVSSGESAPAVIALLQNPETTSGLQAQLVATFEGIEEGRRSPRVYPQPKASDYDVLVAALEARGWKKDDLTLFADSQKLAQAPPETVCRLVTEWFEAQIAIKDTDVQLRLIADSLRPVVAG
jgi:hypothetical protein